MQNRSSKNKGRTPPDFNQVAKRIVDLSVGNPITEEPLAEQPEKNPAAVALGRLGGLKGGKARAEKLSDKRRKEIAQQAAFVRWSARSPK